MNISVTACINAAQPVDQAALGAAVRYAAVDKDIVIVVCGRQRRRRERVRAEPGVQPAAARRPARLARRVARSSPRRGSPTTS